MIIGAVVVLALLLASSSTALRPTTIALDPCLGHDTTAKQAGPFIERVWRLIRWERGKPKPSTVRAYRDRLRCVGPENRAAMVKMWERGRHRFYTHRRAELWRVLVTPFPGGGQWWSVPYYIVVCESGVRGYVASGYYGILFTSEVPTWQTWGEPWFAPTPGEASKKEQDIVAHRLYMAYGLQPWECA